MKTPHSNRKGKAGERSWCKRLDILLPGCAPWVRDWVHAGNKQAGGDLVPSNDRYRSGFYVECKSRVSATNGNIRKWYAEARKRADVAGRFRVLLCVHVTRGPRLVVCDSVPGWPDPRNTEKADVMMIYVERETQG